MAHIDFKKTVNESIFDYILNIENNNETTLGGSINHQA